MNRKHENTELNIENGEYAVRRSRLSLVIAAVVCLLLAVVTWLWVMNVEDTAYLPLTVVGTSEGYTYVLSDNEIQVKGSVLSLRKANEIRVLVSSEITAPGTYAISLNELILPEGISLAELTDLTLTVEAE